MMTQKTNYFYDQNQVRYLLAQTNGKRNFNWLFFPGGPGADSSYFLSLLELIELPGNVWLIDMPGNGSHAVKDDHFDEWLEIYLPTISQFENPIIVGHSAGGQFPLLFPELENILFGLVLLNTAPCLWLEEAVAMATRLKLPDLSKDMQVFTENPNQETFKLALAACTPYYFPKESLIKGKEILDSISFNYLPAVWWQRKVAEINFNASWMPNQVPTLIIGAEFDAITPYSLFLKDERFNRDNIEKAFIKNAGHFPWIEQPEKIKALFETYISSF